MLVTTKFLMIVLGCFAIGDILGVASRARLSAVFVAFMLFLLGFLSGVFPKDIIEQAALTQIGKFASVFIVFNMGTGININQMKKEWKVVLMSIIAMAVAFVACLVIMPFIGKESAIVAIPIVNGGINATQIMTEGALEKGAVTAAALGAFIFAVQKFVGTVPASYFGRKEAERLVVEYREGKAKGVDLLAEFSESGGGADNKKPSFYQRHKKYYTNYTCLGITGVAAYISYAIAQYTPFLNYAIWALVLGCLCNVLGLVPPRILVHGKAIGVFMMATFAKIIPSLADIDWADLGQLGFQTVMVFGSVLLFTFVFLYMLPLWKLVGSRNMAVGVAMAQLLGFPATQLVVDEVALAISETEDERTYIATRLTPAFVVSGFVSVTSLSIIVAGVLVNFL